MKAPVRVSLTSKQRKKLRGMANTMEPTLIVGKNNVNDGVIYEADDLLEGAELVKCSVLETSDLTAREACDEVCRRLAAEPVQVIGRKFTIYRRSTRKDFKHIPLD